MDLSHYLSLMLFLSLFINYTHAATFEIRNQCPHTVWAAAHCGCRLDRGQTWTINVASGTKQASVWAQTKYNFDAAGRGRCETSGFGGLLYGTPPNTSTEYALNQFNNLDFFDVSHVDGFNVLMAFNPVSNKCRGIRCTADINGQCPRDLKAPGGYNNLCTVFNTDQYCCNFSRFFKQRHLPNAYSYPKDDQTSTFTCPGGTNYRIVFYP